MKLATLLDKLGALLTIPRLLERLSDDLIVERKAIREALHQPRWGTVMLLWPDVPRPELGTIEASSHALRSPGFASVTLLVGEGSVSGEIRPMVPVPAGAWLVAVGCHLGNVLVGNDLQDVNMPDRSPMVRLTRDVPLGVLVRFRVVSLGWVSAPP
jgi:hypothetical protein